MKPSIKIQKKVERRKEAEKKVSGSPHARHVPGSQNRKKQG